MALLVRVHAPTIAMARRLIGYNRSCARMKPPGCFFMCVVDTTPSSPTLSGRRRSKSSRAWHEERWAKMLREAAIPIFPFSSAQVLRIYPGVAELDVSYQRYRQATGQTKAADFNVGFA